MEFTKENLRKEVIKHKVAQKTIFTKGLIRRDVNNMSDKEVFDYAHENNIVKENDLVEI